MKKHVECLFLLLLISSAGFSQTTKNSVTFYSAVSDSADLSMIRLTQDLFYSQLSSLDTYTVIDKRTEFYSNSVTESVQQNKSDLSDYFFYVEIQQKDLHWLCTLHAISNLTGYHALSTKEYESYYMILLEAKNALSYIMERVRHPEASSEQIAENTNNPSTENEINSLNNVTVKPTVELLAGTWKGDPSVDKIVILRGGRGFAIFKNGASMNITVSIIGNTVSLTQSSKTNASFYPDLPRDIAISYAVDAQPISWNLALSSETVLFGNKSTLQPLFENSKAVAAEQGTTTVELVKQN